VKISHLTVSIAALISGLGVASATVAQDKIDAIEPSAETINVGLAGEDPANIARYIMARGAGQAKLSPDGLMVAFQYDITGARQIWTIPITGGQAQQQTFGNGVTFFEWAPEGQVLVYGRASAGLRGG